MKIMIHEDNDTGIKGYIPVKNYRRGADDLQAFMADRGDDGREIGDAAACPMSRS